MVKMLKLTEVLRLDREAAARFFAVNGQYEETKRRLRWDLHQDIERLRQLTRDLNAPEKELRETVLWIKIKRKDLNDLSYKQLEDELNLLRPDQQARYILFTIDFRREIDNIVREVRDERPPTARPAERWAPLLPGPQWRPIAKATRTEPVNFNFSRKNMLKLKDKVTLVTGAGQGIGRAIALLAAREGARVALIERNETTGRETLDQLNSLGAEGLLIVKDIALDQAVPEIIERVRTRWNRLDILVNNAGFDRPAGIFKIQDPEWDAVLGVHLKAAMAFIRAAMPIMKEQGYGRIVNLSSIYGKTGGKGEIAYATAKAGLIGLTKSVAKEVGKFGVCVNAVLPGLTATPAIQTMMAEKFKEQILSQTPLGRMAQPEEIAHAVIFLASDEASYITGACLEVSGGWEM